MNKEIQEWFENRNFKYDQREDGFQKNDLFIPSRMAEDIDCREQFEKFNWMAENNFKFMVQANNKLWLSDEFVGIELREFLMIPKEMLIEQIRNLRNKNLN